MATKRKACECKPKADPLPGMPCIRCGADAVALSLASGTFSCDACKESYAPADVRAVVRRWRRLLDYLGSGAVRQQRHRSKVA